MYLAFSCCLLLDFSAKLMLTNSILYHKQGRLLKVCLLYGPVCTRALLGEDDTALRSLWPIYWHKGNPVILSHDNVRRELNSCHYNHRRGKFGMKTQVRQMKMQKGEAYAQAASSSPAPPPAVFMELTFSGY